MTRLLLEDVSVARSGRVLFTSLSGDFPAGSLVTLVGPNGSGKTSLLRTLAGFLRPETGAITVHGRDGVYTDRALGLHLLGHRDGLKGPLSATAHLSFWRGLLGGDGAPINAALTRVGLAASADLPVRMFSAGMGRRLALARLLIAYRPVWLLDEPAAALDAAGKALLNQLIEEHRAGGGIVVAAVHEPLGAPTSHTIQLGAAA